MKKIKYCIYKLGLFATFLFFICFSLNLFCIKDIQAIAVQPKENWRIRIFDAAVVEGSAVILKEIAEPLGGMPSELWNELKDKELWAAPAETGKPMSMNRNKIKELMQRFLGEYEKYFLYPATLVLQRGGAIFPEDILRKEIVKILTQKLIGYEAALDFSDFKLPKYIFLPEKQQHLQIEAVGKIGPGRISLRFAVVELDETVVRRITGSVFVDVWREVPCAAVPLNKYEVITPDKVTYIRKNLAHLKSITWDGQNGPYRLLRPIGANQVIYEADLSIVPIIAKGSKVRLIYDKGGVRLEVMAEALEDAGSGAVISVRNLQSKKVVSGIVKDANTVIIR